MNWWYLVALLLICLVGALVTILILLEQIKKEREINQELSVGRVLGANDVPTHAPVAITREDDGWSM